MIFFFASPVIFSSVAPVPLLTLNMHIQHIKTSEVKTLGWCACLSALKPSTLSFPPSERVWIAAGPEGEQTTQHLDARKATPGVFAAPRPSLLNIHSSRVETVGETRSAERCRLRPESKTRRTRRGERSAPSCQRNTIVFSDHQLSGVGGVSDASRANQSDSSVHPRHLILSCDNQSQVQLR